jgi:hypothetical protein
MRYGTANPGPDGAHLDFEMWETMNLDGLLFVFLTIAEKLNNQPRSVRARLQSCR